MYIYLSFDVRSPAVAPSVMNLMIYITVVGITPLIGINGTTTGDTDKADFYGSIHPVQPVQAIISTYSTLTVTKLL